VIYNSNEHNEIASANALQKQDAANEWATLVKTL